MKLLEQVHDSSVHPRRVRVLSSLFSALLPSSSRVLDVGCGDGLVGHMIRSQRPDVELVGVELKARPRCLLPVREYDGRAIPYETGAFEVVMLVDVLHHASEPEALLRESARVASRGLLIKDHLADGPLARSTLRLMDWVGNAHIGIALPYDYWPERRWRETFARMSLKVASWNSSLHLYPWPASLVFDRSLHFVSYLVRE